MAYHFLGIDVGTGSARAGVFDGDGRLAGVASRPITLFREAGEIFEQSSDEIWAAVCAASREALAAAGLGAGDIAGMGVDATCSLVVLGPGGQPLAVGPSEDPARNIIVWMDHRATDQANRINAAGHPVLDYVGGRISPEMETPKLLWLLEYRPETFARAWQFFDLADYLTWRATGSLARSSCTLTCKWTYLAHQHAWDPTYFEQVGLGTLADEGFARIGTEVVAPGAALGNGLTEAAAADLGLQAGTPVGAGLIDAHAGGIGTVGAGGVDDIDSTMAYVFGTSSCTMTTTAEPVMVPGVWGPYHSAMVPGLWLNEGGQSAAGAAIERLLSGHPAYEVASAEARQSGHSLPDILARAAVSRVGQASEATRLASTYHVVPEVLGNRAPFADPNTRAIVLGIGLEADIDDLVSLYVAAICGLAYGLRQIIEAQAAAGIMTRQIVVSGGAARGDLVRQLLADGTGCTVIGPETEEPVLLGAAILGAVASGAFDDMTGAMARMSRNAAVYKPATGALRHWHENRFDLYQRLHALAREAAAGT
ncbi:MAG: FGGY-family carbohydrate kinase [Rhodobacteraceae bacterium]|nr:FGGY-family carbohydrate kinase [Paracoccaceae bacterium]